MRTGANNTLDEEPAESEFRRLLRSYGEPSNLNPPPDLVVRTARQIPDELPAHMLRRYQFRRLIQWIIIGLFLLALMLGIFLLFATGPTTAPFGDHQAGIGHSFLTLQLMLKPLKGLLSLVGLPLLLVGVIASIGASFILNRTSHSRDVRAGA